MRPGREKRDRKRAAQEARSKEKFRQVMALLGIEADIRSLPLRVRESLRQPPYPKPTCVIEQDAGNDPDAETIRRRIDEFTATETAVLEGDSVIALADFFTTFVPLLHRLDALLIDAALPKQAAAIKRAKAAAASFYRQNIAEVLRILLRGVDQILSEYTRIDRGIWWAGTTSATVADGRRQIQVTVHLARPRRIMVGLDGKRPQPAFWCGGPHGTQGVRWVSWPSRFVRRGGDDSLLPVYVQQHALDQLRERVPITGPGVEDYLWQSLVDPKLLPGDRTDEFLAEYRLYQYVLGYLPVRRLPDKIIVKTFLFLTMSGTPQQRLLFKKLGLERRHREQQSLDQLTLYLTTDIQTDPVLRRVFAECGCGHLFDMIKPEFRADAEAGLAGKLRRFLGIESEADLRGLGFVTDTPSTNEQ